MKEIDDRQHEIYRLSSSKKRAIKAEEQYRDYQLWHMDMQKKLDVLKQQKKEAKKQIGLVDMAIKENLYTAYHDAPEKGEFIDEEAFVIPWMEEAVACKGLTDEVDTVEVERADAGVSVVDTIHREKKQEKDASEDVSVDNLEYVGKAGDGETSADVHVQKY